MDNMIKSMMLVLFVFAMVACGSPEVETTETVETEVTTDTTATEVTVDETTDTDVSVEEVVPVQ